MSESSTASLAWRWQLRLLMRKAVISAILAVGCGNGSSASPPDSSPGVDAPDGVDTMPPDAPPDAPPSNAGLLVFAAALDGQLEPDLYKVDRDGTTIVRLTFTPGAERVPSWSPDHTQIAFVRDFQLFAIDADGGNERRIAERSGRERYYNDHVYSTEIGPAAWSPDGTLLAYPFPYEPFIRDLDGDLIDEAYANMIHLVNADGTDDRLLPNSPGYSVNSIAFSPDGTTLSFSQADDCPDCAGGTWAATIQIDGTAYQQLASDPFLDNGPNKNLDWSADGRWVYLGGNNWSYDQLNFIYTSAVGGASPMKLVDQVGWSPRWSADGSAIAYLAADGVYVVGDDGSNPHRIVMASALFGLDW